MLVENCLSTASDDSMHDKEHLNITIRNLRNSLSYSPDIYRSADDILSMSVNFKTNKLRRYSSLNQKDLEAIDFISLEERKKRLLRDKYEEERIGRNSSKKLNIDEPRTEDVQGLAKVVTEERLDKDDSTQLKSKDSYNSMSILPYTVENRDESPVKKESQFKRAIKFFKNLEESASGKRKPLEQKKCKPEIKRRFSLDIQKHQKNKLKPGGSLRVPKTLEKFSITQIYFDIMSNRRGSFKGSPNRKALSETLASLRTNETSNKTPDEDSEDCIEYNMFVNKLKTKKRKSIKSVFDIHY
ncbi:hypothetical protein WA026_004151 [Henosepilachna vigintioctopunctata]|uniref:Uncharacterized protein n=1 Tax=Henosepilachna vigintioctopunctata TaxID=420089 RepID=A0AAW1UDT2_9CUCU